MSEDSFEQVKKLMRTIGGKAIIVDDGKPSFVIIDAEEYLDFGGAGSEAGSEAELIEKINKDITVWKNRQKEKELRRMEKEFSRKEREVEIVSDDASL